MSYMRIILVSNLKSNLGRLRVRIGISYGIKSNLSNLPRLLKGIQE